MTASSIPPADSASATPQITTQGLVKTYGERNVVNGVDITVHAGEIVGLLGPNGAGKTTSFYMIVGLVPATAGKVSRIARTFSSTVILRNTDGS